MLLGGSSYAAKALIVQTRVCPLRRDCDVLISLKKALSVDRPFPYISSGDRVQRDPYRVVFFLVVINYDVFEHKRRFEFKVFRVQKITTGGHPFPARDEAERIAPRFNPR